MHQGKKENVDFNHGNQSGKDQKWKIHAGEKVVSEFEVKS